MVYVDDLLITSGNEIAISETKQKLSEKFSTTDLREVNYFLGIKFENGKSKFSMKLSQTAYV